nr:reverse transcriptase domain-containing protein [Tanacetum cinerariifolium]
VLNSSPTLTPFGDSDFLLEKTDAFLAIDDEPISLKIEGSYYDPEGDIFLLEEFLNDDPSSPPLPPQELKVIKPINEKSSIDEPPVVELKDLPPHLEYAFLEGDDKLLVIIAKDLKDEEKTSLIKVLKSHKQALAWKLSLPKKQGDPGKFLIPCDFSRMDECLALADLGASINLMPLSVWNKLSLPKLSPTCMTLKLTNRSISRPTGRALIDVYEGELTLRLGKEAVTFNLNQTSRYSANYDAISVNRIDLIDIACEEYSQEVLEFSVTGNPTLSTEPVVLNSSPTLTPFGDSDFLLEKT